jgi:hypothetical protein
MRTEKSGAREILELVVYCAVMYAATHPGEVSAAHDRVRAWWYRVCDRVESQVAVWDTLAQIRSLPETS